MEENARFRSTTIVAVRRDGRAAMAGDGQVSLGQTVMKASAKKVRRNADRVVGIPDGRLVQDDADAVAA